MKKVAKIGFLFLFFFLPLSFSGDCLSVGESFQKLSAALKKKDWKEGIKVADKVIASFDETALYVFGPKFGEFWFYRGYCSLKLGEYEEATKSFQRCFEGYPNSDSTSQKKSNQKISSAKLYYADALKGMGDFPSAISSYQEFLSLYGGSASLSKFMALTNLGISHLSLSPMEKERGYEFLGEALRGSLRFPQMRLSLIAELSKVAMQQKNQDLFLDFLVDYREFALRSVEENAQISPMLVKLASRMAEQRYPAMVMEILRYFPSRAWEGGDSLEDLPKNLMFEVVSRMYLREEFFEQALAGYTYLEKYGEKSRREEYAFRVLSLHSKLGNLESVWQKVKEFEKQYPKGEYLLKVYQLLLFSDYQSGNFESAVEVGLRVLKEVENPSPIHELCLYAIGSSFAQLKQYSEAKIWLGKLSEEYPRGKFREKAEYLLLHFPKETLSVEERIASTEEFLEKNSGSGRIPELLYQLIRDVQVDNPEKAQEFFLRLKSQYPSSPYLGWAFLSRSEFFFKSGEKEKAIALALEGLDLVDQGGFSDLQVVLRGHLILLLSRESQKNVSSLSTLFLNLNSLPVASLEKIALPADVFVYGMKAAAEKGNSQEAVSLVWKMMSLDFLRRKNLEEKRQLINSLASVYGKFFSLEEFLERAKNFSESSERKKELEALLLFSGIESVERELRKKDIAAERANSLRIQRGIFTRILREDFEVKSLPSVVLLSLSDFFGEEKTYALELAEEALKREDNESALALIKTSEIRISLGEKQEVASNLERAFSLAKEKKHQEKSLYILAQFYFSQEKWEECLKVCNRYLKKKERAFFAHAPEMSLLYAQCYDSLGLREDAISAYTRVFGSYIGYIRVSSPAILRWMQLIWERNIPPQGEEKKGDRESVLKVGSRYIKQTQRLREKMTLEEENLWEKVASQVKDYEQILSGVAK